MTNILYTSNIVYIQVGRKVEQLAALYRMQGLRKAFRTVAMHVDLHSQISEKYWYEHWVNIGVNMAKSRSKKESYRDR
jgi:hypothetical protein